MPTSRIPKPELIANPNFELVKRAAEQLVETAWNEDENVALWAFRNGNAHQHVLFAATMMALFGSNFFQDHYAPRSEELGVSL